MTKSLNALNANLATQNMEEHVFSAHRKSMDVFLVPTQLNASNVQTDFTFPIILNAQSVRANVLLVITQLIVCHV